MTTKKRQARFAGLLYLAGVPTSIFSLVDVPSRLVVAGDAAATIQNIEASEPLFRAGIYVGLLSAFSAAQLEGVAYLFVRLQSQGIQIIQIFWGALADSVGDPRLPVRSHTEDHRCLTLAGSLWLLVEQSHVRAPASIQGCLFPDRHGT